MSSPHMNYAVDYEPTHVEASVSKPYPPSLLDRLMDRVERFPIPYGLTYLALFLLECSIIHVLAWVDGWLPAYTFSALALVFPLWLWGPLAVVTYLDATSRKALSNFSPLLDLHPETLQRLAYEFTTMPAWTVFISGVIWSIVYFAFTYLAFDTLYDAFALSPFFRTVTIVVGWLTFSTGSVLYYHSIRQLRLVNRTVRMAPEYDLFHLEPVYAFSVVTSRTAIAWVILLSFTLLLVPIDLAFVPILSMLVLQVILAVATFALPLRIVNVCLVHEKRRLLAELDQRIKTVVGRLHHSLDGNELAEAEHLSSALAGLKVEHDILAEIRTWPWRPGLLTSFVSVILLPIILFLVQLAIQKWIG